MNQALNPTYTLNNTLKKYLTQELKFGVSRTFLYFYKKQSDCIGLGSYLHQIHKKQMMQYIEAQVDLEIVELDAIRNFFKKYNLEEEDYSWESACRAWRRAKKKKLPTLSTNLFNS